ncbi:putative reverse transcriptase domain-containing protein [Tanacetum coccineum]
MSSATSNVTYTSVYSDSEPGRAFWGTDYEEIGSRGVDPEEYEMIRQRMEPRLTSYGRERGRDEEDDEDEEEEEEHLAPADSTVIPADEPVFPPEGTEPVIPPPSTDITIGARITIRPHTSISLPPEAEFERPSLTMTTPITITTYLTITTLCRDASQGAWLHLTITHHYHHLYYNHHCLIVRDEIPESCHLPARGCICPLYAPDMRSERVLLLDLQRSRIDYGFVSMVDTEVETTGDEKSVGLVWCSMSGNTQDFDTVWKVEERPMHPERLGSFDRIKSAQSTPIRTQHPDGITLRSSEDMRREMSDMQAELLALREQRRTAGQPGPEARIPDHQEASGDADIENQVKFATCTLLGAALTWWNGQMRTLGPEAYAMTWEVLKKKMTDKYCPQGEIKKLEIELWNLKVKGNDVPAYTERFQELTLICTKFVANETEKVDKYIGGLPDTILWELQNRPYPRHD